MACLEKLVSGTTSLSFQDEMVELAVSYSGRSMPRYLIGPTGA